jgi:signal transduction histidine kinase
MASESSHPSTSAMQVHPPDQPPPIDGDPLFEALTAQGITIVAMDRDGRVVTAAGAFRHLLSPVEHTAHTSIEPLLACLEQPSPNWIQGLLALALGGTDGEFRRKLPPLTLLATGEAPIRVTGEIRRNSAAGAELVLYSSTPGRAEARMTSQLRRLGLVLPHALRSPLTAVSGFSEMLTDHAGNLPGDARGFLGQIGFQTRLLGTRMAKLESLLHLMQGGFCSSHGTFRIIESLNLCIAQAQSARRTPAVQIDLQVIPPDAWVSGCRRGLEFCMDHLIENACIAASATTGGRVQISIAASEDGTVVRICDNGRGIPERMQSRIMDALDRSEGGIGLGLCGVATFAEMHQASVSLQSSPGNTCFTLHLPWPTVPAGRS